MLDPLPARGAAMVVAAGRAVVLGTVEAGGGASAFGLWCFLRGLWC
jgi:hypothetical protein